MKFLKDVKIVYNVWTSISFWQKNKDHPELETLTDPMGRNALDYLCLTKEKTKFSRENIKKLLSSEKFANKQENRINIFHFGSVMETAFHFDKEIADFYIDFITKNISLTGLKDLGGYAIKKALTRLEPEIEKNAHQILMGNDNQVFRNLVILSNLSDPQEGLYMPQGYLKEYVLNTQTIEPLNFYYILKNQEKLELSKQQLFDIALKNNYVQNFNQKLLEDCQNSSMKDSPLFNEKIRKMQNEPELTSFFVEAEKYMLDKYIDSSSKTAKYGKHVS